jgi:hypothetical protein
MGSVYTAGYKTVRTFANIMGRKLFLKNGREVFNSGNLIQVPFQHRDFFRLVEHQLSHVLFQTDPVARKHFVSTYVTRIAQVAKKGGVTIDEGNLQISLSSLVDILEDARVMSLWSQLFPGSYVLMRKMFYDEAFKVMNSDHHAGFLGYFLALSLGIEPDNSDLDRYRPFFIEALRKVRNRGFDATLLISKWLVTNLINELIREAKGEEPQECPEMRDAAEEFLRMIMDMLDQEGGEGEGEGGGAPQDGDQEGEGEGGDSSQKSCEGEDGDKDPQDSDSDANGEGGDQEGEGEGEGEDGDKDPQDSDSDANREGEGGLWNPPPVSANLSTRATALHQLLERLGQLPKELRNQLGDTRDTKYRSRSAKIRAGEMGSSVVQTDVRDADGVDYFLAKSANDMDNVLSRTRVKMAEVQQCPRDAWLTKEAMAKVVFHDIGSQKIEEENLQLEPLEPEDRRTVKRMKALFMRVLGRRRFAYEETGVEIDVASYIEQKTTHRTTDCFKHEEKGQGFKCMILVDLSSSMLGSKGAQTERACRIIRRALHFPFSQVLVWGFDSCEDGLVDIYRFEPKLLDPPIQHFIAGTTPIHTAVRLAARQLEDSTEDRHLIILTDGMPVFSNRQGRAYGTKALIKFVHDAIQKARTKGVHVTTMLVGSKNYSSGAQDENGVYYDIDVPTMRKMFGTKKTWKRVNPDNLGRDLIAGATNSFVNYLRRM